MKLIFDIGASEGFMLEHFVKKADKVIAFEPNLILLNQIREKFKNYNVIFDSRALSNEVGEKLLNISDCPGISTFSDRWMYDSRFTGIRFWHYKLPVKTTTLDSIITEYGIPDYIKIDVEAHEYEVLTSFTQLLPNTIIGFEWSEELSDDLEKIINHMSNLGYKNFAFTDGDDVMWDEDIKWKTFKRFTLLKKLKPSRKERWGMIYVKK